MRLILDLAEAGQSGYSSDYVPAKSSTDTTARVWHSLARQLERVVAANGNYDFSFALKDALDNDTECFAQTVAWPGLSLPKRSYKKWINEVSD